MTTATSQDTEITLGTGKMLALFFGLVALCAVFFGLGFSLGRSSVRMTSPDLPSTASAPTSPSLRPSAVKTVSTTAPADMTFYKAVQSKDDNPQPASPDASTAAPDTGRTSRSAVRASARNSASFIVASKAVRSAASRSAGRPGGVANGRAMLCRDTISLSAARWAGSVVKSMINGTRSR